MVCSCQPWLLELLLLADDSVQELSLLLLLCELLLKLLAELGLLADEALDSPLDELDEDDDCELDEDDGMGISCKGSRSEKPRAAFAARSVGGQSAGQPDRPASAQGAKPPDPKDQQRAGQHVRSQSASIRARS